MLWDWLSRGVLTVGSRAAENCEPGQDRKVAAISGNLRVMRDRLTRATGEGASWSVMIDKGCTVIF